MYHPSLKQPRETLTVRCCGLIYKKWRIVGREWKFENQGHQQCLRCEKELVYRPHTAADPIPRKPLDAAAAAHRRVQLRYATERYREKRKPMLAAQGLNSRGQIPKKRSHPELAHLHGQKRKNALARKLRAERRPSTLSPMEQAWRAFRSTMEEAA